MYLFRLVTLAALSGALTVPLAAQGIPRNAARSTVNVAPRFMVANPFAFAPADSAPAVAIGTGLREEMKGVVGRDFQVVEQQQMNDALTQYGYPKDTNLGRLITIFEELRESSQLIVITHQKRTMEIADALYGVTMRGDGVSMVISQRIEREG